MLLIPANRRRPLFPAQFRIMLTSCLITGALGHAAALFRKFSFHDDQYALFGVGTTYLFGRWMLGILAKIFSILLGGHYSASLFNGMLSFMLIGAAGCFILHLLGIRSRMIAGLIGAAMVLYPSVTGLLGYMFTAPYYMTGMLMAVIAVWLFVQKAVPSMMTLRKRPEPAQPAPEARPGDHIRADADIWAADTAGRTSAAAGTGAITPAAADSAAAGSAGKQPGVKAAPEHASAAKAGPGNRAVAKTNTGSVIAAKANTFRKALHRHPRLRSLMYVLASVVLLGSSAGVYQAYLPLAMGLLVLYFLSWVLEKHPDWRRYMGLGLMFILFVVVSTLFYLAANRFFLSLLHISMSDYASLNVLGNKGGNADYPGRVLLAYRQFFAPDAHAAWNMYPLTIRRMYQLLLILCAVLAGRRLSMAGSQQTAAQSLILLGLFPLAVNFIFVLSDIGSVHTLMMYPGICVFWLAALLCSHPASGEEPAAAPAGAPAFVLSMLPDPKDRTSVRLALQPVQPVQAGVSANAFYISAGAVLTSMLMLLMVIAYLRFNSICYMKAEFLQSEAIGYFTTLATRMQSAPGYRDGMNVIYLNPTDKHCTSLPSNPAFDEVTIIPYADATLINDYTWPDFMANWCGFRIRYLDIPDGFEDRPEILNMSSYPDDGSIRVVDDVLVVKF